jgi:uncharacterized protein (TIGR00297 family)
VSVLLQAHWWFTQVPAVTWTVLVISSLFGLIVWWIRAGTAGAAALGAGITASLMFSTTIYPYQWSWLHGGLLPLLAVFLLTWAATKIGRARKERLGTAESKRGRNAAQVAANLGAAALVGAIGQFIGPDDARTAAFTGALLAISALAEAAADTVSSEIGQVLGGSPRMITTLRKVEPGTDGGITLAGTIAGVLAATATSSIGLWAIGASEGLFGYWLVNLLVTAGAVFGLLFDSLLGATLDINLERHCRRTLQPDLPGDAIAAVIAITLIPLLVYLLQ